MNMPKRVEQSPSIRRSSGVQSIPAVRRQAALVRTLLDEVERVTPSDLADPIGAQLVEELGRLGCRCVELAAALAKVVDEQEEFRHVQPAVRCA